MTPPPVRHAALVPPGGRRRRSPTIDRAAAGLDVVVEHGVLRVEVLGLEVGAASSRRELSSRSGVGRFDREMSALMYAELPPVEALATVAAESSAGTVTPARHPTRSATWAASAGSDARCWTHP